MVVYDSIFLKKKNYTQFLKLFNSFLRIGEINKQIIFNLNINFSLQFEGSRINCLVKSLICFFVWRIEKFIKFKVNIYAHI